MKKSHVKEFEQMLERAEREWQKKIQAYLKERKKLQEEKKEEECLDLD
jgi:hypothetical protein